MGVIGVSNEKSSLLVKKDSLEEDAGKKEKYPRAVFFILGNEFCERFCFYGMRTILTIYLTEQLLYSESKATLIFHSFVMLAYFSPLFGAILADSWLGKFRTILYISIVYAIGNIILSFGSVPNTLNIMKAVSLIGLLTISIGTGGIKPCVSAFGGDQFSDNQEKQRQKFFSIFYFAINSGSVVSTLLTPILREDVYCFGSNSCYPLAFGVPAILMIVSLALFLLGKPLYVIRPAEGNIFSSVFKCISHAISRKVKNTEEKKKHWLDYADDKFDKDLITDIRKLLNILWILLPLPVFWALFDQQGSSWTLQAKKLDGKILGFHIKPDQMQVMNSLFIIVLIPVFDYAIYPLFSMCNLFKKPLQRIAFGGFLSAFAFVVTGVIELKLENGFSLSSNVALSELTIINNSPCLIKVVGNDSLELKINQFELTTVADIPRDKEIQWQISSSNCSTRESHTLKFNISSPKESMMINVQNKNLHISKGKISREMSESRGPNITHFMNYPAAEPSPISILSQVPAYLLITAGEIMFSITGLEFSYSQAPQSMKSVLQAAWLLTVAIGNLLVMIVAKLSLFDRKSNEMFLFAVIMALDMVVFSVMAYFYKSSNDDDDESSTPILKEKGSIGHEDETHFNK